MTIRRRALIKLSSLVLLPMPTTLLHAIEPKSAPLFLGQGTMSGEATDSTVLLQTRLTATTHLNANGDLPGADGVLCFEWSLKDDFTDVQRTPLQKAQAKNDFIVRTEINQLNPNTLYYFRARYGSEKDTLIAGPTCSFKTLPGGQIEQAISFIVGSCMNYNKFLHGKAGKASGPLTATDQDKNLGFPAFEAMLKLRPTFFVGTGDIVYYDNALRVSKTVEELRKCWHEQFRFPRTIDFFRSTPAYWSKDDHDFRYNESDNSSDQLPLSNTGIELFREQMPIVGMGSNSPTYRTHRVSKQLQVWLTEGRDYRSPNEMADGENKSLWGKEQREWLKKTLLASDAKWKILISPTPMVGPDDGKKIDNHADIKGFMYEANEFFAWLKKNNISNLILVCGDRHWQYHSVHPSGIEEFACGALNDENARLGMAPGDKNGSDRNALIQQKYTSPTPNGGFLHITAGDDLEIAHYNSRGDKLYFTKR